MNELIEKLKKVKPSTVIRTAALGLALVNQMCNQFGFITLADKAQNVYNALSWILTAVTGTAAWWKNNSFSEVAIKADEMLDEIRKGGAK